MFIALNQTQNYLHPLPPTKPYMQGFKHRHTHIHTHTHMCRHAHVCTQAHKHTHTDTHRHTHTHTPTNRHKHSNTWSSSAHTLGRVSVLMQCCKTFMADNITVFIANGSHSTMERSLWKKCVINLAFYAQSNPVKENTNSRQLTVTAGSTITRSDLSVTILDFKAFDCGIICELNFFGEMYLALKL